MKNVLIIGASRGLGLEFARQYAEDGCKVYATFRKAKDAKKLEALGVNAIQVDVIDDDFDAVLKKALGRIDLDVAIYNSGMYGSKGNDWDTPDKKTFDAVMRTNVLGAMRATPAVAPRLVKKHGCLAYISSNMGSIAATSSVAGLTYRASKAAVNMVVKAASVEWGAKGVTCFAFHPGWVKTDMGGANAQIEASVSIKGMRKVIETGGAHLNGKFVDYTGKELLW
jgi:NAD(P)-dependent dehydrogenase (short-subunit alcohol dehydrogenase family)